MTKGCLGRSSRLAFKTTDRKTTFCHVFLFFRSFLYHLAVSPLTVSVSAPGTRMTRTYCLLTTSRRSTWRHMHTHFSPTIQSTRPLLLHPPYHSSADVAMDKVLPADLSAVVPEIEVEQHRAQASRCHRQVAEVLLVPGDVPLQVTAGRVT